MVLTEAFIMEIHTAVTCKIKSMNVLVRVCSSCSHWSVILFIFVVIKGYFINNLHQLTNKANKVLGKNNLYITLETISFLHFLLVFMLC